MQFRAEEGAAGQEHKQGKKIVGVKNVKKSLQENLQLPRNQ